MLESPRVRAARAAFRGAFGRSETRSLDYLRDRLARAQQPRVAGNLGALIATDRRAILVGTKVTLDQAATFHQQIVDALQAELTDRSAPWDPTSDDFLTPQGACGELSGAYAPSALQRVAEEMLAGHQLRQLPDGTLALRNARRLPQPHRGAGTLPAPGGPVKVSSDRQLIAQALRRGGPLMGHTLNTPLFRALRITPRDPDDSWEPLTCTAVTVDGSTLLTVAHANPLTPAQLTDSEQGSWWFWRLPTHSPLSRPSARVHAAELDAGEASLKVFATTSPHAAADALADAATQLGLHEKTRVLVEFDIAAHVRPRPAGGTPRGPELGTCRSCSNPLTTPLSAARGYGPICWDRLLAANPNVSPAQLLDPQAPPPPRDESALWAAPLDDLEWAQWVGLT